MKDNKLSEVEKKQSNIFEISIKSTNNPENKIVFYSNEFTIHEMFKSEWCTNKIEDAKTNETYSIKEKVFDALKLK